jgi:hypothetical protein
MMRNAVNINWDYIGDAVPAFVALALIPFTCTSDGILRRYMRLIPPGSRQHRVRNYRRAHSLHSSPQRPTLARKDLSATFATWMARSQGTV